MERVDPRVAAVRSARFAELSTATLYGVLRLRAEVFVVEQQCVYLDLDGRDTDPTTTHWWIEGDGGDVLAYLRLLRVPSSDDVSGRKAGSAIGRVVTAGGLRNRGLGSRLLTAALRVAPRPVRIDAQSRLVPWYATFGFVTTGDEFLEDGIAHVPLQRS
ncbi:MAG TPA: GNAT family N-acetyltransferase [Acidimicrobiales bacterium]